MRQKPPSISSSLLLLLLLLLTCVYSNRYTTTSTTTTSNSNSNSNSKFKFKIKVMECCGDLGENISKLGKRAIEELIRGREFTTQLEAIIIQHQSTSCYKSAKNLVVKILESLNGTISILTHTHTHPDDDDDDEEEVSQFPPPAPPTSTLTKTCYKRRKISETHREETSTLIDDGHSWRKYGQKMILNAKHPRNYFRCSHKYDQGCQATKQVQKIEDDPPKYVTTYYGPHICKIHHSAPPPPPPPHDSSILLSFATHNITNKQNCTSFPLLYPQLKNETKEQDLQPLLCQNKPSSSDFETSLSSLSDHGDVISSGGMYSCTPSPTNLELELELEFDMLDVPLDFGDVFEFGF